MNSIKEAKPAAAGIVTIGHVAAHGYSVFPPIDDNSYYVDVTNDDKQMVHVRGKGLAALVTALNIDAGNLVMLETFADGCEVKGVLLPEVVEQQINSGEAQAVEGDRAEEDNQIINATPVIEPENAFKFVRNASSTKQNAINDPVEQAVTPTALVAPASLLNGRFIRDDAGVYRRSGEVREALADEGDKIRFIDKQMDAFEAGVELAKAKGWQTIEVTGTDKFKADAWFHAKAAGLDVIGYEATEKDLTRLKKREAKGTAKPLEAVEKSNPETQAVAASAKEAKDFVFKSMAEMIVREDKGSYTGKILHDTTHHVVQDAGMGAALIHSKSAFDPGSRQALVDSQWTGKAVRVQYQQGKGTVQALEKAREGNGR